MNLKRKTNGPKLPFLRGRESKAQDHVKDVRIRTFQEWKISAARPSTAISFSPPSKIFKPLQFLQERLKIQVNMVAGEALADGFFHDSLIEVNRRKRKKE